MKHAFLDYENPTGSWLRKRRGESEMEAYFRNSAREKAMYLHKSEHAILRKAREDELVTDTRTNSW